jgi:hypothetical protein
MDASSVSTASPANLQLQVGNEIQRRAQDIQAQTVEQLVNSLPDPQPVTDPNATVGSNVNIFV